MEDVQEAMRSRAAAWAACLLAGLLLSTGLLHFLRPSGFETIVPRFLGARALWVYLSGAAELGCALALVIPASRRLGGLASAALFVAVFPANVQMALAADGGRHDLFHNPAIAWARLPLQIPLVLWALFIARHAHRRVVTSAPSGQL